MRSGLFHILAFSTIGLSVFSTRVMAAEFVTSTDRIAPSAVTSGGQGGISFPSYDLNNSAGEVGISSLPFASYVLYPGLMNRVAFPGAVTNLANSVTSSVTVRLSWNSPGYDGSLGNLQTGTSYYIQHATWSAISWNFADAQVVLSTSGVAPGTAVSALVSSMNPNTTYFLRLWTKDVQGNLSGLSNGTTAVTLAQPPQNTSQSFLMVGLSSITVAWAALPISPSSSTAEGYLLQASTASDFTGTIVASSTPNISLSTLTVAGLFADTTYYFRVGSLNWDAVANFTTVGSTKT
ncbi:MAG: fibronectin type III domain-containing protein, partial [Actinomycetota bacterium]